jgi:hypothetical protein
MADLKKFFSKEEKEHIEVCKELCDGMSVEGDEIICFEVLDNLLNGERDISKISKDTLLKVYLQLNLYKGFWKEYSWFNNEPNKEITRKFKGILKEELSNRNTTK